MYSDCITVILLHNLLSFLGIPRTNQYKYYNNTNTFKKYYTTITY